MEIGDRVTTNYKNKPDIIYTLSEKVEDKDYGSGYRVKLKNDYCKCCNQLIGPIIRGWIDMYWIKKYKEI